eukprot:COSAG01_NODE_1155_length_11480_cov_35.572445_4_plen_330_part_00
MRWSQLGSMPTAPNPTLGVNTFVAMTYDLPDPQYGYNTQPYGNCSSVGRTPGDCFAPRPGSNGPIHPRNKLEVGRRLALAALAVGRLDCSNSFCNQSLPALIPHPSGPVFAQCTTAPSDFQHGVPMAATIAVVFELGPGSFGHTRAQLVIKNPDGFEAQLADQSWVAAPIVDRDACAMNPHQPDPFSWICLRVQARPLPLIGLRLHWRDNPCCPRFYGNDPAFNQWYGAAKHPNPVAGVCPPKNCSVYSDVSGKAGASTELPAVPFITSIDPRSQTCTGFATQPFPQARTRREWWHRDGGVGAYESELEILRRENAELKAALANTMKPR